MSRLMFVFSVELIVEIFEFGYNHITYIRQNTEAFVFDFSINKMFVLLVRSDSRLKLAPEGLVFNGTIVPLTITVSDDHLVVDGLANATICGIGMFANI
jgi:hypothetical protein